jgi:repressor LexA
MTDGTLAQMQREAAAQQVYGLTRGQYDCLCVIQELMDAGGVAPSLAEIAHELGLKSKSGAHALVSQLVARGYLGRMAERARSLVVLRRVEMPDFSYGEDAAETAP